MDRLKNRYFKRNAFGVSVVEFFWGLGIPVVIESTFLQLFLKNLGASSFAIGIVPALFMVGISCFPLFSSYFTRNFNYKRITVLVLHLGSAGAVLLFGTTLLLVKQKVAMVLPLFFFCYGVFSVCMGLTIPVWFNYLVKIFSETRSVPGLGYMMMFQNFGKIISSFFMVKIVDTYAFSLTSSAWIFIATGLLFIVGSVGFVLTKEIVEKEEWEYDCRTFCEHTRSRFKEIIGNRNFLFFLAAMDLEFVIIITTLSFYANYATTCFQIPQAVAAGFFVACIYSGSITVNIILGTMNLLRLKQKFLLSKVLTLLLLVLLAFFPGYLVFFLVSYLLGVVRAIRNTVYPPLIKKFSGRSDATSYFAFAPLLSLPLSVGYPLFFGSMLDHFSAMGQQAYQLLFCCSAILVLVSAIFAVKTRYHEFP